MSDDRSEDDDPFADIAWEDDDEARALNKRHLALMPQIPVWQPNQDAVMAPSVEGYTYQFHRQVDYRDLSRK